MYRDAPASTPKQTPPRELIYDAKNRSDRASSAVIMFRLFALPMMAGGFFAAIGLPLLAVMSMLGVVAYNVWRHKRKTAGERIVLRVDNGALVVSSIVKKRASVRLAELNDVVLDVKTIQRVQEGNALIPETRFINATAAAEVDTARIVLDTPEGRTALTDDFLAHMDATEWLGKIRVFLRKNGWVPADEVEPAPESVLGESALDASRDRASSDSFATDTV